MNERKLTKSELAKREDTVLKMKKNKRALVQKYGKDAEAVMYGRATNLAKKEAKNMDQDKIRELVKDALQNPKKADLNKDGKLSSYEKTRGAAIEKAMIKEWGGSDQLALLKSMHRDLSQPTEFPGLTQIMYAAGDATDFYMDDFEEYDTNRESLVMNNARSYARKYFPDFMEMAAKMVEPSNINRFNETLDESSSTEEKRIAMSAINVLAKRRGISTGEARADLIRAAKEIGDLKEDLDLGHEDNEPGMLKAELYHIGSYAMELYKMMDNLEGMGEEIDLPAWWQSKITTAKNMISGAKHYLEFELKEPAIDAMVDTLSENEDSTDEAEKLIIKSLEDEGGAAGLDPLIKAVEKLDMSKDDVVSLLKKMAKVKLHKNGDYILFPVNEGLPKGFWDKKMDAKDEVTERIDYDEALNLRAIKSELEDEIAQLYRDMEQEAEPEGGEVADRYGNALNKLEDRLGKVQKQLRDYDMNESYNTLVNKIKKQGKSEKAAKAIAGAVASYKAKGGGKGPTAKQKG